MHAVGCRRYSDILPFWCFSFSFFFFSPLPSRQQLALLMHRAVVVHAICPWSTMGAVFFQATCFAVLVRGFHLLQTAGYSLRSAAPGLVCYMLLYCTDRLGVASPSFLLSIHFFLSACSRRAEAGLNFGPTLRPLTHLHRSDRDNDGSCTERHAKNEEGLERRAAWWLERNASRNFDCSGAVAYGSKARPEQQLSGDSSAGQGDSGMVRGVKPCLRPHCHAAVPSAGPQELFLFFDLLQRER